MDNNFDIGKVYSEIINSSLAETINKHNKRAAIILELPTDNYCFANSASVRYLTENGYEGLYISFQRPYDNISCLFDKCSIDKKKVHIIDYASSCIEKNFEEIGKSISESLKDLKSKNKFILIDSLSTIALYKKESEISKFTEKLTDLIKKDNSDNLLILFNVAEDLVKKPYIKKITSHADEVINVLNQVEDYSRDVINPGNLT